MTWLTRPPSRVVGVFRGGFSWLEPATGRERAGVAEYWLIDPETATVEVLVLEAGEYRLAGRWRPGEQARSRRLEGFTVEVAALFAED